MNIFLTGASGFLGTHLAHELIRRGHKLTALVRPSSRKDHLNDLGIELIEGTFPDPGPLAKVLSKMDGVIHVAGAIKALSEKEFNEVNAEGTSHLVREFLAANPKPKFFLQVSTVAVVNPNQSEDYCLPPENYQSLSFYGESKRRGELALAPLKGKTRVITLRPPVLYGPQDYEFLPFFKSIRLGLAPLFRDGSGQLSVCYGPDAARALADIVEHLPPEDKIYCLDDGEVHTWRSLAKSIASILDKKPIFIQAPLPIFYATAFLTQVWAQIRRKAEVFSPNKMREIKQDRWVCGHEQLTRDTGWKPKVGLKEGMKKTYEFYQSEKLI